MIEEWYGNLVEPRIGEFLERLESIKKIDSNDEGLIWLLTSLFLRNPSHRNSIESPLKQARKIAESMRKDLNEKDHILDTSALDYNIDDIIEYELKQTKIAASYFPIFNYTLIKCPSGINTITNDTPLILTQRNLKIFGLTTKGTMILAPLNKNINLLGSKEVNLKPVHKATETEIAHLNTMVMNSANERIYCNNDHFFILNEYGKIIKYPC